MVRFPQPGELFVRRAHVSKMEAAHLIRIDGIRSSDLACKYTVMEDDLYPDEVSCVQFDDIESILKHFQLYPHFSKIWRDINE